MPKAWSVQQARKASGAHRASQGQQVVQKAHKVRRASKAHRGSLESRVLRGPKASQEPRARSAQPAQPVRPVPLARQGFPARKVFRVLRVPRGQRVQQAPPVHKAQRGPRGRSGQPLARKPHRLSASPLRHFPAMWEGEQPCMQLVRPNSLTVISATLLSTCSRTQRRLYLQPQHGLIAVVAHPELITWLPKMPRILALGAT